MQEESAPRMLQQHTITPNPKSRNSAGADRGGGGGGRHGARRGAVRGGEERGLAKVRARADLPRWVLGWAVLRRLASRRELSTYASVESSGAHNPSCDRHPRDVVGEGRGPRQKCAPGARPAVCPVPGTTHVPARLGTRGAMRVPFVTQRRSEGLANVVRPTPTTA